MGYVFPSGTNHALASSACVQDIRVWGGGIVVHIQGGGNEEERVSRFYTSRGWHLCMRKIVQQTKSEQMATWRI